MSLVLYVANGMTVHDQLLNEGEVGLVRFLFFFSIKESLKC